MGDRAKGLPTGPVYEAKWARIVLADCRAALEELREEPTGDTWRIRWVGMLALLRAVRDVMTRIDGESDEVDPKMREEIGKFWKRMKATKPEPAIYWEFICEDANNILHYYKFSAVQTVTRRTAEAEAVTSTSAAASTVYSIGGNGRVLGGDAGAVPVADAPIAERAYPMKSGSYEGQDQRDVVQMAIDWWEEEIGEMEARAMAAATTEDGVT